MWSANIKTKLNAQQGDTISLKTACLYWLKLGFISFGGPAGQIALMHQDLVENKRWISEKRFLHALNFCMLLPGPEAQQLATYIGWLMHKTWGGIIAGALFVLPSFFILIGLAWVYLSYGSVPAIAGLLYGIKPAVVAIVLLAAHRIGRRTLNNRVLISIALAAFIAIFLFKLAFPVIILCAALLGYLGSRIRPAYFMPERFQHGKAHASTQTDLHAADITPAVIADDTPAPSHAIFSWRKLISLAGTGLALWSVCMLLLWWKFGWHGAYTQMAWFFSKAALLTFGGAYAVLPYVFQGAVEHYHWLTPAQMIDGLALGETTPGPLIMIVTFVGFVGGWSAQVFGAHAAFASAMVAASVVTLFTFLPSFVFIFMGGPCVLAAWTGSDHRLVLSSPDHTGFAGHAAFQVKCHRRDRGVWRVGHGIAFVVELIHELTHNLVHLLIYQPAHIASALDRHRCQPLLF